VIAATSRPFMKIVEILRDKHRDVPFEWAEDIDALASEERPARDNAARVAWHGAGFVLTRRTRPGMSVAHQHR
jgi:hypothetical protein